MISPREIRPCIRSRRLLEKYTKAMVEGSSADEGGGQVRPERDPGEAEGVVQQGERKDGDKPGEGHDLPAMPGHFVVQGHQPGSGQLLRHPVPGQIAGHQKDQPCPQGGAQRGIDHPPEGSEEHAAGQGNGEAREERAAPRSTPPGTSRAAGPRGRPRTGAGAPGPGTAPGEIAVRRPPPEVRAEI